jgi:multicomponent Na+:H+ antiporter subunit B
VNSLILQTTTRVLVLVVVVFSFFMLLRGHNAPGGGFIAGLLAATAFSLHLLAFGAKKTRELLQIDLRLVVGLGLGASTLSGLIAVLRGQAFMTGQWLGAPLPALGKVGSVLLFDIGVYLAVFGTVLLILLSLGREETE